MMMKSVFWWRKPEYPEETTDLRQVTDETAATDGGDVFANDGFKIRGWDETGLQVGSVRRFGSSIGTLVTADADVARKPAEVNVEARCFE